MPEGTGAGVGHQDGAVGQADNAANAGAEPSVCASAVDSALCARAVAGQRGDGAGGKVDQPQARVAAVGDHQLAGGQLAERRRRVQRGAMERAVAAARLALDACDDVPCAGAV